MTCNDMNSGLPNQISITQTCINNITYTFISTRTLNKTPVLLIEDISIIPKMDITFGLFLPYKPLHRKSAKHKTQVSSCTITNTNEQTASFVQNSYIKNEERVQTVHRDAYNQLNNNHGEQFKMDIKKMTKTHNYFLHNKLKSTDRYLKG